MKYDKNAWERLGNSFTNNYELGLLDYRKHIIDVVLKYQDECENLLDIGCADGWFIEQFRQFGFKKKYFGIDVTPNLIKRAKRRMPKEQFAIADAMDLNIKPFSVDFVLCAGVLMHLPDLKKAMSEAFRVSRKYVFISTYGTYGKSYCRFNNSFMNHFYNGPDVVSKVPSSFKIVFLKAFKREGNNDHMFQYLFKLVNQKGEK